MSDKLWYWTQLAIWPFIRGAGDCVYCIFLRGFLMGSLWGFLGFALGTGLWLIYR